MERAGARYRGRDVQRRCRQNVGAQGVGRGRQQGRRFLSRQASKTRRREVGWKQNHFQMRRQLRGAIIEVTRAPTEADALKGYGVSVVIQAADLPELPLATATASPCGLLCVVRGWRRSFRLGVTR